MADPSISTIGFARAWFKLTTATRPPEPLHRPPTPPAGKGRDRSRPNPGRSTYYDVGALKLDIAASALSVADMVATAWDSAAHLPPVETCAAWANGARIRLAPQKDWEGNDPSAGPRSSRCFEPSGCKARSLGGRQHSCWPAIVGVVAGGQGRGHRHREVPFTAGPWDSSAEQTDAESFSVLEPLADGFATG